MLSPILRRLCVTSSESSTEEIEAEELPAERGKESEKEKDKDNFIVVEEERRRRRRSRSPPSPPSPDIEAADSRAISSSGGTMTGAACPAKTEKLHQQHSHQRSIESGSYSIMSRSKSHQQTLTKDEARKRMMSWRKTTRPRRESHALNSN